MFGEHHDNLAHEFPEFKDKIHTLKTTNAYFTKLSHKYEEVAKEIYRIEEQIEVTSDDYLEGLKKKGLALKDELYTMLRQA